MNRHRGEVVRTLGGTERRLCLTLGALAEMETAFGLDGWEQLADRLRRLSARDLRTVLSALLCDEGVDLDGVDFREAAEAVAAAFAAA